MLELPHSKIRKLIVLEDNPQYLPYLKVRPVYFVPLCHPQRCMQGFSRVRSACALGTAVRVRVGHIHTLGRLRSAFRNTSTPMGRWA